MESVLGDRLQPRASRASSRAANELPTVNLPEADLRDKIGAYRLKSTGMIWRITLQDGALQLTDHLLATSPLRPLSATRFDPEGSRFYATTQFVFSRPAADSPMGLTSQWDEPENRGSLEFEPVELVDPKPDQLMQYAGDYMSDELAATYRFMVRQERLWLRVNSRRWEQLDATVRDEFAPHLREPADGRIITFLRDEKNNVNGLSIDYFRGRESGSRGDDLHWYFGSNDHGLLRDFRIGRRRGLRCCGTQFDFRQKCSSRPSRPWASQKPRQERASEVLERVSDRAESMPEGDLIKEALRQLA